MTKGYDFFFALLPDFRTNQTQKSVPDLTPERDQLNQDQSHVHDLLLTAISPADKVFVLGLYWL